MSLQTQLDRAGDPSLDLAVDPDVLTTPCRCFYCGSPSPPLHTACAAHSDLPELDMPPLLHLRGISSPHLLSDEL